MEDIERFEEAKRKYIVTKVLYEFIFKEVCRRNRVWHEKLERGEITEGEWAEKTTDEEFKPVTVRLSLNLKFTISLDDARRRLRECEEELLDTGAKLLICISSKEEAETVKYVFEEGRKHCSVRDKIIDLLLRWNVSELKKYA